MSDFSIQQNKTKEKAERNKTRRDKLASYFLDLSKLTFAASVLGGFAPLLDENSMHSWLNLIFGIIATFIFAKIGNSILK